MTGLGDLGEGFFVVVGVVVCVLLGVAIVAIAYGRCCDAVRWVRQCRARARFSREAYAAAMARLEEQHAARVAAEAEDERQWAQVLTFPKTGSGR